MCALHYSHPLGLVTGFLDLLTSLTLESCEVCGFVLGLIWSHVFQFENIGKYT